MIDGEIDLLERREELDAVDEEPKSRLYLE